MSIDQNLLYIYMYRSYLRLFSCVDQGTAFGGPLSWLQESKQIQQNENEKDASEIKIYKKTCDYFWTMKAA